MASTIGGYCLMVLEPGRPRSPCWQVSAPAETPGASLLVSSSSCWWPAMPGVPWLAAAPC